jgi:SAM-dependent methyltransferase
MSDVPNEASSTEDFEFAALQKAENYRAALVSEFSPYLKGSVMEVGAGIGQITAGLKQLPSIKEITCVEPDARFFEKLRANHRDCRTVHGIVDDVPAEVACDAIVSVNVLEHIREDRAELVKYKTRLAERSGYLCLFVPARQEIYAPLDADFGHFRRYSKPELRARLVEAGFEITRLVYFNWIGYFGWWASFCLLKKRSFDLTSVLTFDRLIFPPMHWCEAHLLRPPFGQSLLAIAKAAPSRK